MPALGCCDTGNAFTFPAGFCAGQFRYDPRNCYGPKRRRHPGATVTILNSATGVSRTLTTDSAGLYNAPTLIPGTYTVRAEAKSFKVFESRNVVLEVGKDIRVDAILQPGGEEQTITVTAAAPMVSTTDATLGGTIQSTEMSDLPLN